MSARARRWIVSGLVATSCTAASVASHPDDTAVTSASPAESAPTPTPKPSHSTAAPDDAGQHGPTIAAGVHHTCAVRESGIVWCWGDNRHARLGVGSSDERVLRPRPVEGLVAVVEIAADFDSTCARDREGAVWCWGENDDGELATGDDQRRVTPTKIVGVVAKRIVVGFDHACAITAKGTTQCWGSARFSDGGHQYELAPTVMPALAGATALALTDDHDCAIVRGAAWCWGLNNSGQLGTGRGGCVRGPAPPCGKCLAEEVCEESRTPAKVIGLAQPRTITATNRASCALDARGALWCWGDMAPQGLATSDSNRTLAPLKIAGLPALRAVELDGDHGCGIAEGGGALWCWGQNVFGEVGVASEAHDVPMQQVRTVAGGAQLGPVLEISLGLSTTCARTAETLWCWGNNTEGQLGDGTTEHRSAPVAVRF